MNARPAAVQFGEAVLGLIAVYGTPFLLPTARSRPAAAAHPVIREKGVEDGMAV
jgi:hypothetical protein